MDEKPTIQAVINSILIMVTLTGQRFYAGWRAVAMRNEEAG